MDEIQHRVIKSTWQQLSKIVCYTKPGDDNQIGLGDADDSRLRGKCFRAFSACLVIAR